MTTTSATTAQSHIWLNLALRGTANTPPSGIEVALFTSAPSDAGGGTESAAPHLAASFGAAASRQSATTADLDWASMPATETLTHVGLFDATTDELLFWGELDAPVAVTAGDPLTIAAGDLVVQILAGAMSDTLAHALLDHTLRGTTYTPPASVELALLDGGGAELSGSGYARQALAFGAPSASSTTANTNAGSTTSPAATISAFRYHAAGGATLFSGTYGTPRTVTDGATVEFAAGSHTATIN